MDINEEALDKAIGQLIAQANVPTPRIDIGKDHYIEFDLLDGWFYICDEDWATYDRGGAVGFSLEELDSLIGVLGKLRETWHSSTLEVADKLGLIDNLETAVDIESNSE